MDNKFQITGDIYLKFYCLDKKVGSQSSNRFLFSLSLDVILLFVVCFFYFFFFYCQLSAEIIRISLHKMLFHFPPL